jgi:hypothetical protein
MANSLTVSARMSSTIVRDEQQRHDLRDLPVREPVLAQLHHLQKCSPALNSCRVVRPDAAVAAIVVGMILVGVSAVHKLQRFD